MSRTKYISALFCCLLLFACKGKDNSEQIIVDWQGKELILPEILINAPDGDTIWTNEADYTIIAYFDSLGCTSCKLHLSNWNSLFNRLNDKIIDSNLNPIIIINTNKKDDILDLIDEEFYQYPVVLDPEDSINSLNVFPTDEFFRTFLLDKRHRVIAIGNPLYNNAVEELYFSLISGITNYSDDYNSGIKVNRSVLSLGLLHPGKTVCNSVTIKNIGNDTVTISKIDSSCDCSEASISSNIIPPAESCELLITFRPDSLEGDFYRTTSVYYDNFSRPTIITQTGTISDK